MCTFGLSAFRRSFADASFGAADVGRAVDDLPLQVAEVDDVEVDDAEGADAGGGKIHRGRRAKPARADAQHLRGFQLALTFDADLRHDQVAAVSLDLVAGQLGQRRLFLTESIDGAPPATDGMMLTVSPDLSGV